MDAKVTLSFDAQVIAKAKAYAESQGLSLSRLTEVLLRKAVGSSYSDIESMPVADWVSVLAEGDVTYGKTKNRKELKESFYNKK
jgi:hypothetical protein